jgi:hypothetical protein
MRVAAAALAALAPMWTLAGPADATQISGLHGIVMQGPTSPVCRADDPCEEPARGLILQFRRDGKVAAEVKTSQTGRYSVKLAAGSYAVKAPGRRIGSGLTPRIVRVRRGQSTRVDFSLDTGIQ